MPPTYAELQDGFQLGSWTVFAERGLLQQGDTSIHLEPMVMDVLLVLVSEQGKVVSRDLLIERVWHGRSTTDDAIATKIAALRHALGDDRKNPTYVQTVQKRGYRLKASVELRAPREGKLSTISSQHVFSQIIVLGLLLAAVAAYFFWPPGDSIQTVAVMQFRNLSDDKQKYQYIVDGFSEELVVSLNQIPDLRFIRGSGISGDRTPQQVAEELGVDAVISGSLRTDGDNIRITVELTSASGFQIWAGTIDGAAKDIFGIQERVASEARNKILGERGQAFRAATRPSNAEAFDYYMRGMFFLAKRDLTSLEQARELFEKTIQIDPAFGPAYLRQAIAVLLLADYKPEQKGEIYNDAFAIAARGAELDPDVRDPAQLIYGFVHHQRGQWAEAADAFDVALRGLAAYPTVYNWHSRLLGDLGLTDQSLQQALVGRAIEPASQILNSRVAIAYLWNGDMANARHYFDVANTMGVGNPIHHMAYTVFLLRDNNPEKARAAVKTALELSRTPNWWVDPVFDSLDSPDDSELRNLALDAISIVAADGSLPPQVSMMLWSLFGQTDQMMEIANQQVETFGAISALELIYLGEYRAFRQHTDFPRLLDELGLTQYWASIGCRWNNDQLRCRTM